MPATPLSHKPRIAIAGATGRVGAALTASLVDAPVRVRALTRNPGSTRFADTIDVGAVDFDDAASLERALQGVERLFIAHGTSTRQVANEMALIDAAVASGVKHIVKLSALGPPSSRHPNDWHMVIEAHLAKKEVGYTVLRPGAFADVLRHAGSAVVRNVWGGAAGDGVTNFIDTRDVADVARVALLDEALDSQRAYHLTGPKAWSMSEIALELSSLLGRQVSYEHRTPAAHRAAMIAAGVSDFVADLLLGLDRAFRESALAESTSTVEQLTGHAPRPLTQWLSENIGHFKA